VLREVFGDAASFATDARGLGDALLSAADRPVPGRQAAGRELAARHTWNSSAAAHRQLYESLD
jgi:hypothetical protein